MPLPPSQCHVPAGHDVRSNDLRVNAPSPNLSS